MVNMSDFMGGLKKQRNPFGGGIGLGSSRKKETGRDSRRAFTQTQKNEIWAQQNGRCASSECNHSQLDPRKTQYDHKKGWADRGKTVTINGQALCLNCHGLKTHGERLKKVDKKRNTKTNNNPFSANIFGSPPKQSRNNPFRI